jgi:hypothetical protein
MSLHFSGYTTHSQQLSEKLPSDRRRLLNEGRKFHCGTFKKLSEDVKMLKSKKISSAVAATLLATLALAPAASAATPTYLTTTQKTQLKHLIEEEKLARDVYTYLSAKVTTRKFSNISRSEQTHMNYMATLLTKYKQVNPTTGKAAGVFASKDVQDLYDTLTVEGAAGVLQANGVGVKIENVDIASIKALLAKPMPVDVKAALDLMLAASYNHLEAFSY